MEALIFPALLFIVMYVVLIRPQQRKQKEQRALLSGLREGDEIITTSGIHGFITSLEDNVVWVEVAAGMELKMSRSAIAGSIADPEASDDDADDDDDRDDVADDPGSGLGDTDVIGSDD